MKTLNPHDWREKHPRCSFCQWLKFETVKVDLPMADYHKCIVKNKIINCTDMPRPWCKCFKVKLEKEFRKELITNEGN